MPPPPSAQQPQASRPAQSQAAPPRRASGPPPRFLAGQPRPAWQAQHRARPTAPATGRVSAMSRAHHHRTMPRPAPPP
eukprot:9576631-Alexandrium_andersonii.AAC.1